MTTTAPQSGDPAIPSAQQGVPAGSYSPFEGGGLLELVNVLLKQWAVVLGLPLLAGLLTGALSLLVPPTFTATSTFVPEIRPQRALPSGLIGLAGQLGVSLGGEASQSPRFYAEVAESRELLERVLLSHFADPRSSRITGDSVTLLRLLQLGGRDSADSVERGVRRLRKLVGVSVDNQTSIVTVSTDARSPSLAAAVANRLVEYLNDFNTRTRQSQARERRKFVEQRVADGEHDLRAAEEDLRGFYERNRSWQQSPQLVFDEGRLRRQVEIRQEIYVTLKREYETARIEEVNDTPVITVIDPAVPPHRKSRPNRTLLVLMALALGGLLSVSWAMSAEYLERVRRKDEALYRDFLGNLRRAATTIGEKFRRTGKLDTKLK